MERRQQGEEVEAHQYPVVVEEAAGERQRQRQRQVPAAVEVEELADRCLLAAPVAEEGEGEQCSLAEVEDVEEDRLWKVEAAAVGYL